MIEKHRQHMKQRNIYVERKQEIWLKTKVEKHNWEASSSSTLCSQGDIIFLHENSGMRKRVHALWWPNPISLLFMLQQFHLIKSSTFTVSTNISKLFTIDQNIPVDIMENLLILCHRSDSVMSWLRSHFLPFEIFCGNCCPDHCQVIKNWSKNCANYI